MSNYLNGIAISSRVCCAGCRVISGEVNDGDHAGVMFSTKPLDATSSAIDYSLHGRWGQWLESQGNARQGN